MIKVIKNSILTFIPFAVALTLLFGFVYVAVQYNMRSSANDPQLQFAQDLSDSLVTGDTADTLLGERKVDMEKSLATYAIIYDKDGKLVKSTVTLDGKDPTPPAGVFEVAKTNGRNIFTWMPKDKVRSAVVLQKYDGSNPGYILIGRSLSEVEKRIDKFFLVSILGWGVSMVATLMAVVFASLLKQFVKA